MKVSKRKRFVVIMAGGRGERFWPVSRQAAPKQLLSLLGKQSFLQEAVSRVLPVVPAENVIIITNTAQLAMVRRQLPGLPRHNVIAEPVGRDTCAAVALGAALVGARCVDGVMAMLPADHVIAEPKRFQQTLKDCFDVAGSRESIVTIGIQPTEPSTGYGYIQVGKRLKTSSGRSRFYVSRRFVEKPKLATAKRYLSSGDYRWNAGMFIWSVKTLMNGLARFQPAMFEASQRWLNAATQPAKLARVLAREYPAIEKISIDYALMERAEDVVVADGNFAWDDLGSWSALNRHLKADANGNVARGDLVTMDAVGNLVFDARTKRGAPVALLGLRDMILVLTDDATLVARKADAQRVKEVVKKVVSDPRWKDLG